MIFLIPHERKRVGGFYVRGPLDRSGPLDLKNQDSTDRFEWWLVWKGIWIRKSGIFYFFKFRPTKKVILKKHEKSQANGMSPPPCKNQGA